MNIEECRSCFRRLNARESGICRMCRKAPHGDEFRIYKSSYNPNCWSFSIYDKNVEVYKADPYDYYLSSDKAFQAAILFNRFGESKHVVLSYAAKKAHAKKRGEYVHPLLECEA